MLASNPILSAVMIFIKASFCEPIVPYINIANLEDALGDRRQQDNKTSVSWVLLRMDHID